MATAGSVIGSLQVNVVAVTDKFIAGLNKAAKWAGRFVTKVDSIGNSLKSLWNTGKYIWAVIAAAIGKTINDSIESGSKIYELTKRLHATSEEITALHYAAGQLEASTDSVDAFIDNMSITLGKAVNGSHEAAKAFGLLGINFRQLSTLTKANQFLALVEALHNITDESKRAALAQAIGGKGAKELGALYAYGADKIIAAAGEAAKAGNLMGTETARKLDDSGDALARLGASWRAFRDEFVSAIAPVVEFVAWFGTKAFQDIKVFFHVFQAGFAETYQIAAYGVLGLIKLFNLILPKSLKIKTDAISNFIKGATEQRNEEWMKAGNNARALFGLGSAQQNPLQAPVQTAAPHMERAADSLQILVQLSREQLQRRQQADTQPQVKLATAGMR